MSCLDAKISKVPKDQLIVPSTLLAPATAIRTHQAFGHYPFLAGPILTVGTLAIVNPDCTEILLQLKNN